MDGGVPITDICKFLTSSKVTDRSKGSIKCSEVIKAEQTGRTHYAHDNWIDVIHAVYKYQEREYDGKSKTPTANISALVRKVVKHCLVSHTVAILQNVGFIIDSSLSFMRDSNQNIPQIARNEQKNVIIEILSVSIVSSAISTDYFETMCDFMMSSMDNERGNGYLDNLNQKMFKKLCKCCFRREVIGFSISYRLINWIEASLQRTNQEMSANISFITTCLEALTSLIENDDVNIYYHLLQHNQCLLSCSVRALMSPQYFNKDNIRDACIDFLCKYIDISIRWTLDIGFAIRQDNALSGVLSSLVDSLFHDDFIRCMSNSSISATSNGSHSIKYLLEQVKVSSYYQMASRILQIWNQRPTLSQLNANDNLSGDDIDPPPTKRVKLRHSNDASVMKTPTAMVTSSGMSLLSGSNKQMAESSFDHLLSRIFVSLREYNTIPSGRSTNTINNTKSSISSLVNGLILHIIFLCRESKDGPYPMGPFLGPENGLTLKKLIKLLTEFNVQLKFTFAMICSDNLLQSTCCSTLALFNELLLVSFHLSETSKEDRIMNKKNLEYVWSQIFDTIVLSNKSCHSLVSSPTSDDFIELLRTLKSIEILPRSFVRTITNRINDILVQSSASHNPGQGVILFARYELERNVLANQSDRLGINGLQNIITHSLDKVFDWFDDILSDSKLTNLVLKYPMKSILRMMRPIEEYFDAIFTTCCTRTVRSHLLDKLNHECKLSCSDLGIFSIQPEIFISLRSMLSYIAEGTPRNSSEREKALSKDNFISMIAKNRFIIESTCRYLLNRLENTTKTIVEQQGSIQEEQSIDISSVSIINVLSLWISFIYIIILQYLSYNGMTQDWVIELIERVTKRYFFLLHLQLDLILATIKANSFKIDIMGLYLYDVIRLAIYALKGSLLMKKSSGAALEAIHQLIVKIIQSMISFHPSSRLSTDDIEPAMSMNTSSSSSGQMNRPTSSSAVGFDDDDPDFKQSSPRSNRINEKGVSPTSSMNRMTLSPIELEILAHLSELFYLTISPSQRSQVNILHAIQSEKSSALQRSSRYYSFGAQIQLSLAHGMLWFLPPITSFKVCIDSRWQLELDCIGYCQILSFLLRLISTPIFQSSDDKGAVTEAILKVIFPSHDNNSKLEKLSNNYWQCKALQIDCLASLIPLIQSENIECNGLIADLVKVYSIDEDLRVRMRVISNISSLISIFTKKLKVYSSLLEASRMPILMDLMALSQSQEMAETEPAMDDQSVMNRMYLDYHNVICTCLLLSRIGISSSAVFYRSMFDILLTCSSRSNFKGNKSSNGHEISETSNQVTIYQSLSIYLKTIMQSYAHHHGFVNVKTFIKANISWLICKWIKLMAKASSTDPVLSYREFPYKLMDSTLEQFIQSFESNLMTNILLHFPPQRHKYRIQQICSINFKQEDSLLSNQLVHCKMISLFHKYRYLQRGESDLTTFYDINSSIKALLQIDLKTCMSSSSALSLTRVIESIIDEFLSFYIQEDYSEYRYDSLDGALVDIFQDLAAEMKYSSISDIFQRCNMISLFSLIHRRSIDSREGIVIYRIISSLRMIIKCFKSDGIYQQMHVVGMISTICSLYRHHCVFVQEINALVKDLIDYLHAVNANSIYYRIIYCELISVLSYVRPEDDTNDSPSDMMVYIKFIYQDAKISSQFDELLKGKGSAISDSILSLIRSLLDSNRCDLSMFQLPSSYKSIISKDIQELIHLRPLMPFITKIHEFIDSWPTLSSFIGSSPVSLWIEILTIQSYFEMEMIEIAMLRNIHTETISSFITILLDILSNPSYQSLTPLMMKISKLLGQIGPPNIYSLGQQDLPSRPVTGLRHCHQNIPLMIKQLVFTLSNELWSQNTSISELCSNVLCDLGYNRVTERILQQTKSITDSNNANSYQNDCFEEITTNYSHTESLLDDEIESVAEHIANKELWSIQNKSYESWITILTHKLIIGVLSMDDKTNPGTLLSDEIESYIKPFRHIVLHMLSIAEKLFPISLYCLSMKCGKTSLIPHRINQNIMSILSSATNDRSIKSSDEYKAVQICCQSILFIVRQSYDSTMRQLTASPPSAASTTITPQNKGSKGDKGSKDINRNATDIWISPCQMPFGLSFLSIAKAAKMVNATCSAILFTELASEESRVNEQGLDRSNYHLMNEEIDIYFHSSRMIHDPDFVHGYLPESDLKTQAIIYEHDGQYVEALSTYESILQSMNPYLHDAIHQNIGGYVHGLQNSLNGLGYDFLSSKFGQNVSSNDSFSIQLKQKGQQAIESLEEWSLNTKESSDSMAMEHRQQSRLLFDTIHNRFKYNDLYDIHYLYQHENERIIHNISSYLSDEHGMRLIYELVTLQHLTEFQEVSTLLNTSINQSNPLECLRNGENTPKRLIDSWNHRFSYDKRLSSISKSIFDCRIVLIDILKHNQSISSHEVTPLINKLIDVMTDKATAHSLAPLIYRFHGLFVEANDQSQSGLYPSLSIGRSSSTDNSLTNEFDWLLNECKILWKRGMEDLAMNNLNTKIIAVMRSKSLDDPVLADLNSEALRLGGEWLHSKRSATAQIILKDYFNPSKDQAKSMRQILKSSHSLAQFHLKLYHQINTRVTSNEWKQTRQIAAQRRQNMKLLDEEIKQFEGQNKTNPNPNYNEERKIKYRMLNDLKKETDYDLSETKAAEESVEKYLFAALYHFGQILIHSHESNYDLISQLINLWFNNSLNSKVNQQIQQIMKQSLSYKWIPLSYQLFTRIGSSQSSPASDSHETTSASDLSRSIKSSRTISSSQDSFQQTLHEMAIRLCCDHPYHTLPQLFALVHELDNGSYGGAELYKSNIIALGRQEIAMNIVNQLKSNKSIGQLVEAFEIQLKAYIDLATFNVSKEKRSEIFYKDISLSRFHKKPFHEVLLKGFTKKPSVLTTHQNIQIDCNYQDIITIDQFLPSFKISEDGISRPKIITLRGSDGKLYKQIVKGGDDMRQDAVMQQVFENVNTTLASIDETRCRRLSLRTYKIIPLSPQTGLLQYVDNTIALGSYLVRKDDHEFEGAHARYFPKDWSSSECREYILANTSNDLHQTYEEICNHFHPVFRWFFIENFIDPVQWIAARLAYIKSVAATSMIGHILGIGDRHLQNILLDTITGEVIHIDFGMVFEQSKNLPKPEIIPFRLTRDIVDGFGVCGCEGTFRRSCEHVLRVLRENSSQIMTILEVVIHDPLYRWALTPAQARYKQNKTNIAYNGAVNLSNEPVDANSSSDRKGLGRDAAERTLRRVRLKLQGFEDVTGEALSVEGHVGLLINDATDPNNLSKLFCGWTPWA